jgi:hypothetical protein
MATSSERETLTDWNKIFQDLIAEEMRRAKRDRLHMLQNFHASQRKTTQTRFIPRPQVTLPWQR